MAKEKIVRYVVNGTGGFRDPLNFSKKNSYLSTVPVCT